MIDRYGRKIKYLRVSITDRCDLRCKYCMPEGCDKVPMSKILTYEEIERICRVSSQLGISRIKITGGEPFVRLGCTDLMRAVKAIDGIDQVTVTTNGQTLDKYIDELADIGIDGINISLDTLDEDKFRDITGRGVLEKTLNAIDLAASSGIRTKVNCILQKGFNEDELYGMADLAFSKGIDVRFIEMMPIGVGDPTEGISNRIVLSRLMERYPDLKADSSVHGNGPAVYYGIPGKRGGIGLISAIHGIFCGSCNRVRLTSQGQLKPCLCYEDGTDLKPYLSGNDEELREAIRKTIYNKPEAHCFNKIDNADAPEDTYTSSGRAEHRLMSQIGG